MALVRRMVYFPVFLAAGAGLVAPQTASAHLVTSGIGPFYDGSSTSLCRRRIWRW